MNKKIRIIKADISQNIEKTGDITRQISRIKKTIRRRRQIYQENLYIYLQVKELKNLKTEVKSNIDAIGQIISHVEESKDLLTLKIKEIIWKIKNLPSENTFDFTDCLEMHEKENETDLGLFLKLVEENKIIYNQTP